jgi:hypothetical protein
MRITKTLSVMMLIAAFILSSAALFSGQSMAADLSNKVTTQADSTTNKQREFGDFFNNKSSVALSDDISRTGQDWTANMDDAAKALSEITPAAGETTPDITKGEEPIYNESLSEPFIGP